MKLRRDIASLGRNLASGGCNDADWYGRNGEDGRLDPAFLAHTLPIATYANAWWEEWVTKGELTDAFTTAADIFHSLPYDACAWRYVKGPVAAAIVSAARLGWTFLSATAVRTDTGQIWDLEADSPADVKRDIERAVVAWPAANVLENEQAFRHLPHPAYTPRLAADQHRLPSCTETSRAGPSPLHKREDQSSQNLGIHHV